MRSRDASPGQLMAVPRGRPLFIGHHPEPNRELVLPKVDRGGLHALDGMRPQPGSHVGWPHAGHDAGMRLLPIVTLPVAALPMACPHSLAVSHGW